MKTYTVRFIGNIWMPSALCASDFTLTEKDNARFTEPFDLSDEKEEIAFCEYFLFHGGKTGDFQSVKDYEIVRTARRESFDPETGEDVTRTRSDIIRPWETGESELTWGDCMFPAEID